MFVLTRSALGRYVWLGRPIHHSDWQPKPYCTQGYFGIIRTVELPKQTPPRGQRSSHVRQWQVPPLALLARAVLNVSVPPFLPLLQGSSEVELWHCMLEANVKVTASVHLIVGRRCT